MHPSVASYHLSRISVHAPCQSNSTEPQVATSSFEKLQRSKIQRAGAQDIIALDQSASLQRSFSPPVKLPQGPVIGPYEGDIVQVNIVASVWCGRGALRCSLLMRCREFWSPFKQL
jgi:hypothetical protein